MYWYPRYVPVGLRRARALVKMRELREQGMKVQPVELRGRTIAGSFWGRRWCEHLESFSDYANRLTLGRTYLRNGSVCHLAIGAGRVEAMVAGQEIYRVVVRIRRLERPAWEAIRTACAGRIGSVIELLQGRLPDRVMDVFAHRDTGLFPKPEDIEPTCDCPDGAGACRHAAAVIYGVGSRLDDSPELLFHLRGVDEAELIAADMPPRGTATADDPADEALDGGFEVDPAAGGGAPAPPSRQLGPGTAAAPQRFPRRPEAAAAPVPHMGARRTGAGPAVAPKVRVRRPGAATVVGAKPPARPPAVRPEVGLPPPARPPASGNGMGPQTLARPATTTTAARLEPPPRQPQVGPEAGAKPPERPTKVPTRRSRNADPAVTPPGAGAGDRRSEDRQSRLNADPSAAPLGAGLGDRRAGDRESPANAGPPATPPGVGVGERRGRDRQSPAKADLPAAPPAPEAGLGERRDRQSPANVAPPAAPVPPDREAAGAELRPTGALIAGLRERGGFSVAEFADLLQVSAATVRRWEAAPGPLGLHARSQEALTALREVIENHQE